MGLFKAFRNAVDETGDSREAMRRHRRVWREVALRRSASYDEKRRHLFSASMPIIDVTTGSTAVHVDTFSDDLGGNAITSTRFRCAYLLSPGPVFKVYYSRLAKAFGSATGEVDVELGHRCFDEHFMVHTADLAATRDAWSRDLLAGMQRFFSEGFVDSNGEVITLTTAGVVGSNKVLDRGIELVSELGMWGAAVLNEARRLPGALWVEAEGPWEDRRPPSVQIDVLGVVITVEALIVDGKPSLALSGVPERELGLVAIDLDGEGEVAAGFDDDLLSEAVRNALVGVGCAHLVSQPDLLRVELRGEPTGERLNAATMVLAELARGKQRRGVYR